MDDYAEDRFEYQSPRNRNLDSNPRHSQYLAELGTPKDHPYLRRYHACVPCQRSKVRCDRGPVDDPHDPPCLHCRRMQRECILPSIRIDGANLSEEISQDDDTTPIIVSKQDTRPLSTSPPPLLHFPLPGSGSHASYPSNSEAQQQDDHGMVSSPYARQLSTSPPPPPPSTTCMDIPPHHSYIQPIHQANGSGNSASPSKQSMQDPYVEEGCKPFNHFFGVSYPTGSYEDVAAADSPSLEETVAAYVPSYEDVAAALVSQGLANPKTRQKPHVLDSIAAIKISATIAEHASFLSCTMCCKRKYMVGTSTSKRDITLPSVFANCYFSAIK
jgi:hypothetical protein